MTTAIRFKASDNCLTELDVIEAAKAAFADALKDMEPDEEYMIEAAADLAAGGHDVPMWMSPAGFAEAVVQGIEERLAALIRERRGPDGFSNVVKIIDRRRTPTDAA